MSNNQHIVIIGNGISGITAARHIRKNSDAKITVVSGETEYFYSRTALMYVFMGHMTFEHTQPYEKDFWIKNKIDLVFDWVETVDFDAKQLLFKKSDAITYDKLILATGSKSNKFGWKGQDLKGVQGLYNFQDLETLEQSAQNIKQAVLIGGGLIGIELAEMLISRGIEVTFLIREKSFWSNVLPAQDSELVTNHLKQHHLKLLFETELDEIIGDENGHVKKIITKNGEEIDCQFVGLTVGVSPNIDFLKNSILELDRGILVNEFLETSVPNVYAIGDCAQFKISINGRRNIEQVWYTGRMMGETLAHTICVKKTAYTPGNWFNSAKFFDLEYQTYGWVFPTLKDNESEFYWESKDKTKAMHFVFDKFSKNFIGINTFGIRLRHELFDRWLNENKGVEYILEHLKDANFDPEFFKSFEAEIIAQYNLENNASLKLKKKSWLRILGV